jgi:hypothetical protein
MRQLGRFGQWGVGLHYDALGAAVVDQRAALEEGVQLDLVDRGRVARRLRQLLQVRLACARCRGQLMNGDVASWGQP